MHQQVRNFYNDIYSPCDVNFCQIPTSRWMKWTWFYELPSGWTEYKSNGYWPLVVKVAWTINVIGSAPNCSKTWSIVQCSLATVHYKKLFHIPIRKVDNTLKFPMEMTDINPYPAKLNYLNFQTLEVVSRYRDPQLQVVENYSYLFNLRRNIYKSWYINSHFIPNISGLIG